MTRTRDEQRDKGTLASIPNLVAAADYFGLNKVDLLIRFGHVIETEVVDYLESEGVDAHPHSGTTTTKSSRFLVDRPAKLRKPVRANLGVPTL